MGIVNIVVRVPTEFCGPTLPTVYRVQHYDCDGDACLPYIQAEDWRDLGNGLEYHPWLAQERTARNNGWRNRLVVDKSNWTTDKESLRQKLISGLRTWHKKLTSALVVTEYVLAQAMFERPI